ncbi:MAG: non-homologous end-joining DNA ligase [Micropruina sp.]
MRPMLATRGVTVPTGAGWSHEVKWDGMRVLARIRAGRITLTSRNANDVTVAYPELAALADSRAMILDGEVVALANGVPSFHALTERIHVVKPARAAELARTNPVSLLIFDLLALDGIEVTARPLQQRRALLEGLDLNGPSWQTPPVYEDGPMLLDATAAQGLEGVVSKRLDSAYEPGVRSPNWLKFPHRRVSSWVVGGWRPQTGSPTSLGALLVGEPIAGGLAYRGRVGSGLSAALAGVLLEVLTPLEQAGSPFTSEVPAQDAAGARWVEPFLVVDVEALELSPSGRLRQPTFRGVRPDLTPDDLE